MVRVGTGNIANTGIEKHRDAFGGGCEGAGSLASHFRAPSRPISIANDTVRRYWRERQSHPLAVRRFALCAVSHHWHFIVDDWTSSLPRNGAKRKRLTIFPVPASHGRAPAFISNHQKNAHGPLSLRHKRRSPDARPRANDMRSRAKGLHVSNARCAGNDSSLATVGSRFYTSYLQPTVARLRRFACCETLRDHAYLIDCRIYRKSATAEDGNRNSGQV